MKFDNKHIKDWKNYHKKYKRITVKVCRGNDFGKPSEHQTYNFNSEEHLNKWLDEHNFNLGSYDYIDEIIESDVYKFDYDTYSKQLD